MLVVYRTCISEVDGNIKQFRPRWFSKKKCLENAIKIFNLPDIEFIFLYDGDDHTEWYKYIKTFNKKIIKCNFKDNQKSLIFLYEQINFLLNSDINHNSFYLIEDDFLHLEKSKDILEEALLFTGMATLYHHPDRFFRNDDIISYDKILLGKNGYYRTMESTTGTFALTKECFNHLYTDLIKFNIDDRGFFRNCIYKSIRLICPIDTYSTHVHLPFLSLFVDWENFKRKSICCL